MIRAFIPLFYWHFSLNKIPFLGIDIRQKWFILLRHLLQRLERYHSMDKKEKPVDSKKNEDNHKKIFDSYVDFADTDRLVEIRKEKNLSQPTLAYITGLNVKTIQKAEQDITSIYVGDFLKICRGLGIKPVEIIDIKKPPYYHYHPDFDIVDNNYLESESVLTREELDKKRRQDEIKLTRLLSKSESN